MKSIIKKILNVVIEKIAIKKKYFFPDTFIWKWKLAYLFEFYENETTKFFKKNIRKGMIIVDVGANIGYFTRVFSKLVGSNGQIFAFEADYENYLLLKKNTEHLKNVKIFNQAVSDYTGETDFFHIVGATGTHSLLYADNAERRKVSVVTLDDFFSKLGIVPHFIKIDVEGAEAKVFSGMTHILETKPVVVFEYQPSENKTFVHELATKHKIYSFSPSGNTQEFSKIKYKTGKVLYANLCLSDKSI